MISQPSLTLHEPGFKRAKRQSLDPVSCDNAQTGSEQHQQPHGGEVSVGSLDPQCGRQERAHLSEPVVAVPGTTTVPDDNVPDEAGAGKPLSVIAALTQNGAMDKTMQGRGHEFEVAKIQPSQQPLVGRRNQQSSAGLEDTGDLGKRSPFVGDVFQNLDHGHSVEMVCRIGRDAVQINLVEDPSGVVRPRGGDGFWSHIHAVAFGRSQVLHKPSLSAAVVKVSARGEIKPLSRERLPGFHHGPFTTIRAICLALVLLALSIPLAAQTPAFVDAGTFYFNGTIAGNHDCPLMATVNAGELLIIQTSIRDVSTPNSDVTINTVDDWATLYEDAANARRYTHLWWKIADGTEDAENVNFAATTDSEDGVAGFLCRAYRFSASNGFAATPYENVTFAEGSDTPSTVATIAPGGANRLAIVFRIMEALRLTELDSYTGETPCDYTQASEAETDSGMPATIDLQTGALTAECSGASDGWTATTPDSWTTLVMSLVGVADATAGQSIIGPF